MDALRRSCQCTRIFNCRMYLVHHHCGIPVGMQCFKLAGLALFPFGKDVTYGGGLGSFLLNIIWAIFFGIPIALHSLLWGCIMCITIIGIPFGLQHFKMAKLALMPFGTVVY